MDAVVRGTARQIGHPGARHHSLSGSATGIDTSSTCILALDQRGLLTCAYKGIGERIAALARADNDRVKAFDCHALIDAKKRNVDRTFCRRDQQHSATDSSYILHQRQHEIRGLPAQAGAVMVTGKCARYPSQPS